MMEDLSKMVKASDLDLGWLTGFKVANGDMEMTVSHLFFADCTIFFCEDDVQELLYLRSIWFLRRFLDLKSI